MKVAEVYYTGPGMHKTARAPSDEQYTMSKGSRGAPDSSASAESVRDALYFDGKDNYRVEWTTIGQVAQHADGLESPADGIGAMLNDMGYRAKQRLAKSLDLKASGSEDELDERLRPEVERLQRQMEADH